MATCVTMYRPHLGHSLFKVVAAGMVYFSLALVDSIINSHVVSGHHMWSFFA